MMKGKGGRGCVYVYVYVCIMCQSREGKTERQEPVLVRGAFYIFR